jgi:hypothetical protein
MVVVDNARRLIGRNADVSVTSVLQTTAGKMIFGRIWEETTAEAPNGNTEQRANGTRRPLREVRPAPVLTRITDQTDS